MDALLHLMENNIQWILGAVAVGAAAWFGSKAWSGMQERRDQNFRVKNTIFDGNRGRKAGGGSGTGGG